MQFNPVNRSRCALLKATALATGAVLAAGAGSASAVVTFGQIDNFSDGTTMGWIHGTFSPAPPTNMPSGGPGGANDAYLQNSSVGGFGPASRHVVLNDTRWIGNFNAAGITRLTGQMANFGNTDLHMRIAARGGPGGSAWASTNPIFLPAGSGWTNVTFDLTPSAMTQVLGSEDLSTVLGSVNQFRILSAQLAPSFLGDIMVGTLGVDNLRAMRLPGDANFDGLVNLADFNILAANFGTASGATWQQADFNFDGLVNLADFNLLAANFGQSIGGPTVTPGDWSNLASAIPEPASAGLLAASLALIGARRRGRGGR